MPLPQQRDPEATRRQLAPWLARRMPQARELAITNLAAPVATGFSNDTLLFDLEWTEDGRARRQEMVVRIEPSGFTVFPAYDVGQQFRIMQRLGEATDVPVPPMYWLEERTDVLGARFFVMGKVDGRVPPDNPPYHAAGWMTEIAPAERAALWWDGLEVLARIHRLDWRRLGFDFLAHGTPGLDAQLDYYARYLAWAAGSRPEPVIEAGLAWLRRHRPADEPLGLCWGDARIGNMIFAGTRCRAVSRAPAAAPSSTGRWRRSATPNRTSPGGSSSIGTTARGSESSASRASRGGRRRSRATRSSWVVRSGTSTTTRCSPPSASPSSCAGSGSC